VSDETMKAGADEAWEELAEGILSLRSSDGWHALVDLTARLERLAMAAAIDGKPEDLTYHRGWRDCALYLRQQLGYLPEVAVRVREEKAASPEEGDENELWALAAGAGPL